MSRTFLYNIILLLCLTLIIGCQGIKLTDIYFVNLSNERIAVSIQGIIPSPAPIPRTLRPGTGTTQLTEISLHLGDPVIFDDTIKITWSIENESTKKEVELNRKDFGIPTKVQGGKVKIIYTASGEWEMKYSRYPTKWK